MSQSLILNLYNTKANELPQEEIQLDEIFKTFESSDLIILFGSHIDDNNIEMLLGNVDAEVNRTVDFIKENKEIIKNYILIKADNDLKILALRNEYGYHANNEHPVFKKVLNVHLIPPKNIKLTVKHEEFNFYYSGVVTASQNPQFNFVYNFNVRHDKLGLANIVPSKFSFQVYINNVNKSNPMYSYPLMHDIDLSVIGNQIVKLEGIEAYE